MNQQGVETRKRPFTHGSPLKFVTVSGSRWEDGKTRWKNPAQQWYYRGTLNEWLEDLMRVLKGSEGESVRVFRDIAEGETFIEVRNASYVLRDADLYLTKHVPLSESVRSFFASFGDQIPNIMVDPDRCEELARAGGIFLGDIPKDIPERMWEGSDLDLETVREAYGIPNISQPNTDPKAMKSPPDEVLPKEAGDMQGNQMTQNGG